MIWPAKATSISCAAEDGHRLRAAITGSSCGHRAAFLDAGHFDFIAATIAEHVQRDNIAPSCILDTGSGTGHHIAKIAEAIPPPVVGLGVDISREAARQAARRSPSLAFAVADLWAEWPVRNAAVDLVVNVLAPKNCSEAARVLRPGGWLALVYPGSDHMFELRDRFGLMRRHEPAGRRYIEAVRRFFGAPAVRRLRRQAVLGSDAIRSAILMGPNARHVAASTLDVELGRMAVTFDFIMLFARKSEGRDAECVRRFHESDR